MFWRLVPGTLEGRGMDGAAAVRNPISLLNPKKRCNDQSLDNLMRALNLWTLQSKLGGCTMMKVERCTGEFWYEVNFVVKPCRPRRLRYMKICHYLSFSLSLSLHRHCALCHCVHGFFLSLVMTTLRPYFKFFREITLLKGSTFQALPKGYFLTKAWRKKDGKTEKSYSTFLSICVSNSRCTASFGCKTVLVIVCDPESGRQLCKGDFKK